MTQPLRALLTPPGAKEAPGRAEDAALHVGIKGDVPLGRVAWGLLRWWLGLAAADAGLWAAWAALSSCVEPTSRR
jgi:hypothetical protein